MPRLYRPSTPVEIKCRVVLSQLGEMFIDQVIEEKRKAYRGAGGLQEYLSNLLQRFAALLCCSVNDLRLDHDPALALRKRRGQGKKTVYDPPANDPESLAYRPHGAQFDRSHDVKTRIRGDHGQYSDIALIKRERRRNRKKNAKKAGKRTSNFGAKLRKVKRKWPKQKFPKRILKYTLRP